MLHLPALVVSAAVLVTATSAAAAPRAVVGGPAFGSGIRVMVVGLGFAPPNEFCTPVALRVDGRSVRAARQTDDLGTWTWTFTSNLPKGAHGIELSQTCESGRDGSKRTARARTRLVVR